MFDEHTAEYVFFVKRPLAWPNEGVELLPPFGPASPVARRVYDHEPRRWAETVEVSDELWRRGDLPDRLTRARSLALRAYREEFGRERAREPGLEVERLYGVAMERALCGAPYRSLHDGAVYRVTVHLKRAAPGR